MDALAALGFLEKSGEHYALEPLVQVLLPTMASFGSAYFNDATWTMWGKLSETVRTGEPANVDDEYWLGFARSSRELARIQGMTAREFVGLEVGVGARVLDLGCGSGGMGYAFTIADPTVVVTGVDSDEVLALASEYAEELHIGDRVVLRPVSLAAAPSFGEREFDLVLASNVLHLFDEPTCRELLGKAHSALKPSGRIAITEIVPDEERCSLQYPLMFAVEMLLRTPSGGCYTFGEISGWLEEAGFSGVACHPMLGHTTGIIAVRR